MTREDYLNKLGQLEGSIRTNVQEYNTAYGEKRYEDAIKLTASIEKDISEYNSIAQMLCFDECANSDDPMITAVLKLDFPAIGVRDTLEGDGEIKNLVREVVDDKRKKIDLLKLDKYVRDRGGKGIGHDTNWKYMAERLNLLFAMDCAVEIGKGEEFIKEMSECYAVKEASREIDFGVKNPKAGTPISNTGLLKAVKAVVTAMVGEEYGAKVLTHDVRFLKMVSAKKSKKALALQCANHRYMREYLMEVCNRVITGSVYDVEYKRVKGK